MTTGTFRHGGPLPLGALVTPNDGTIPLGEYTVITGTPSAVRALLGRLDRGQPLNLGGMGFVVLDAPAALPLGARRDTAAEAYPGLTADPVSRQLRLPHRTRGVVLPDLGAGLDYREVRAAVTMTHAAPRAGVQVIASTLDPLALVLPEGDEDGPGWGAVLCATWGEASDPEARTRPLRVVPLSAHPEARFAQRHYRAVTPGEFILSAGYAVPGMVPQ